MQLSTNKLTINRAYVLSIHIHEMFAVVIFLLDVFFDKSLSCFAPSPFVKGDNLWL